MEDEQLLPTPKKFVLDEVSSTWRGYLWSFAEKFLGTLSEESDRFVKFVNYLNEADKEVVEKQIQYVDTDNFKAVLTFLNETHGLFTWDDVFKTEHLVEAELNLV